jgi:hypothetical protein
MFAPDRNCPQPDRGAAQVKEDPRSLDSLKWFKSALRLAQQNRLHLEHRPGPGRTHKGAAMSQPTEVELNEPVPWMQQLLDNPFLLLFLGVLIPMLVYTLWGVIDILTIPVGK